jgi:archaellum component FlaF (FlaF/FlaG flagellin family)
MNTKYIPHIILVAIIVISGFFCNREIRTYKETLSAKEKVINELEKTNQKNLEILKGFKESKNIKTITTIKADGTKTIEQTDLSVKENSESIKQSETEKISEKTFKELSSIKTIEEKIIKNPDMIFFGFGTNQNYDKVIHLQLLRQRYLLQLGVSTDLKSREASISIGF